MAFLKYWNCSILLSNALENVYLVIYIDCEQLRKKTNLQALWLSLP